MTHSVMFHHFHDNLHMPAQGSLSPDDFHEMLVWLRKRFTVLCAEDYKKKFLSGSLEETDVCLSFDDALRCQYDIAIPILDKFGLTAFFFVYSSAFSDNPDFLEIYRYFRTSEFVSVDEFYEYFFERVSQIDEVQFKEHQHHYKSLDYLAKFPFYTENDKWFRYLRDQYLGSNNYDDVMKEMMVLRDFNIDAAKSLLWMSEEQLLDIHQKGHTLGLHSYSHPTQMSKLPRHNQSLEYERNFIHLSQLLSFPINSMSHPCGDYSNDTLEILRGMGIKMGFRSNMSVKEVKSSLEIPREDHANVFREMRL